MLFGSEGATCRGLLVVAAATQATKQLHYDWYGLLFKFGFKVPATNEINAEEMNEICLVGRICPWC